MKFIHAADLHIDSPLRGLHAYEGAPVDTIRAAGRRALVALVDLALRETVAFVVIAGDVFDRDLGDFRAALFFREQMGRLSRAGVRVFIVRGNHDAEGQISRRLPDVHGVHVFSARSAESVDLPELGVTVHGRSFPERAVTEDLAPRYPDPLPGRFNVGVLHTSLNGRTGHDPYAPTDVATLSAKGYDYWALGHVHAREVVQPAGPRIVYPGNLQGRHVGETGSKGCELVTLDGGRIASAEHVPLDVVRWHMLPLDISGLGELAPVAARFHDACRTLTAGAQDRLHAMRVKVFGDSELHRVEARDPGTITATLQAATQDFDAADLWIESVQLDLRSPIDREAAARRPDAVGDVVTLVDELLVDDAALRAWVLDAIDTLPPLPPDLSDADPHRLSGAALRALLADAEATVLARLAAAGAQDQP